MCYIINQIFCPKDKGRIFSRPITRSLIVQNLFKPLPLSAFSKNRSGQVSQASNPIFQIRGSADQTSSGPSQTMGLLVSFKKDGFVKSRAIKDLSF
jgi:hypothetical protein